MKRTPMTRKTPLKRSAIGRGKGPSLRRTPLRKVNAERMARRRKAYAERLRKPDWKELRYQAWQRSGGLCECGECQKWRRSTRPASEMTADQLIAWHESVTPVEIWFVKSGKSPAERFRGGSTHHLTYARLGHERIEDIQFCHKAHHDAIEAQHGYRRRYLASGK